MLQIFRKISKENQRNGEPPWAAASVKKENRVRTKPELLSQRMKREDGSAKDTRKPQQVKSECGILSTEWRVRVWEPREESVSGRKARSVVF